MQRDLQIIGDRIEFMGYLVGNLCDVPATVRDKFVHLLEQGKPMPPYAANYAARSR